MLEQGRPAASHLQQVKNDLRALDASRSVARGYRLQQLCPVLTEEEASELLDSKRGERRGLLLAAAVWGTSTTRPAHASLRPDPRPQQTAEGLLRRKRRVRDGPDRARPGAALDQQGGARPNIVITITIITIRCTSQGGRRLNGRVGRHGAYRQHASSLCVRGAPPHHPRPLPRALARESSES